MRILSNAVFVSLLAAGCLAAYPNGSRIPTGNAGEPGTGTPCSSCHSVSLNPSGGSVKVTLPGASEFVNGATQRWTVTVTDSNAGYRKGFQLTATGGTLKAVDSTVVTTASSGRQYVTHTTSASIYTFDWTAPTGVDSVTVYVAGATVNGTSRTNVYTASLTLKKAGALPAITSNGVVNGATFATGISSAAWATIFGSNLSGSGASRSWTAAEIVNGKFPTTLEGTQVHINGKSAPIAYVSPTQLNVQVPDDAATGPVSVEVITTAGTSTSASADLRSAAPGFFRFSPSSNRYIAAVYSDGTLAAPSGLFDASITVRVPKPGETLLLFGTGFGATDPKVASGVSYSGAAPLAAGNGLVIRIGGVPAVVNFAGLSAAGLYQFNVVVPALSGGDYLVEASAWGQDVPTQQYLTVRP